MLINNSILKYVKDDAVVSLHTHMGDDVKNTIKIFHACLSDLLYGKQLVIGITEKNDFFDFKEKGLDEKELNEYAIADIPTFFINGIEIKTRIDARKIDPKNKLNLDEIIFEALFLNIPHDSEIIRKLSLEIKAARKERLEQACHFARKFYNDNAITMENVSAYISEKDKKEKIEKKQIARFIFYELGKGESYKDVFNKTLDEKVLTKYYGPEKRFDIFYLKEILEKEGAFMVIPHPEIILYSNTTKETDKETNFRINRHHITKIIELIKPAAVESYYPYELAGRFNVKDIGKACSYWEKKNFKGLEIPRIYSIDFQIKEAYMLFIINSFFIRNGPSDPVELREYQKKKIRDVVNQHIDLPEETPLWAKEIMKDKIAEMWFRRIEKYPKEYKLLTKFSVIKEIYKNLNIY